VDHAPQDTDLVLTLDNGETITIAAGTTTGSVTFANPNADTPYVDGDTLQYEITGSTGGNYEDLDTTSKATVTVEDTTDTTTLTLTGGTVNEGADITITASVDNAPQGSDLVLTLDNGKQITITAGTTTGSVTFTNPNGEDVYVDGETLEYGVTTSNGGNYEALDTSATATVTVTDTIDTTTISLNSPTVSEGGDITLTATVDHAPQTTPLVVTLNNGEIITIAVGQTTGSVTFANPNTEDVYQDGQTIDYSITDAVGGNYEALDKSATSTVTVVDTIDTTTVTLANVTVNEGADITISAIVDNAPQGSDLVITLDNGQTITILDGATTGSVTFTNPNADTPYVDGDTLQYGMTGAVGGNFEQLDTSSKATVTVVDTTDTTTLTLTGGTVNEGADITITASVDNAPQGSDLVLTLDNGKQITIAAGTTNGSVTFTNPNGEDVYKDGETLEYKVIANSGGNYEALDTSATASVIVEDTMNTTTISLNSPTVSEGGDITLTATVDHAPQNTPLVLTLSNGEIITIAVGQTVGSVTFTNPNTEDVYQDGETIDYSITDAVGGNYEALDKSATSTVTVVDTIDTTTVTLADVTVNEGADITISASVDNAPQGSDLVITLDNGQTITILDGATTGSVTFTNPNGEDVYKDGQTLQYGMTNAVGGNYEQLDTSSKATVTVVDTTDSTTLTLNDISVNEGTGTAQITASLDHAPKTELVVTLNNGATITFGPTYTPGDLVSSTAFPINNGEDVYVDESSFVVSVTGTTGGNFENLVTTDTATVTVNDTTTPVTAELTVDKTAVSEGAADLVYTVTLKDADGNLTPANNAVTVETAYGQIIIAQGASSGTLVKPVQGDDVYVDGETLSNNITSVTEANAGTAGSFEQIDFDSTNVVSTTVSDTTDTTGVSLTASPNLTEAGGDLTYTVTLDSPVRAGDDPVTVTFTDLNGDSQTITISSGSTGTQLVNIPSSLFEDVYKEAPADVAIATGVTVSGGADFESLGTPTVGTITITDTDTDVTLTLNDVSVNEGTGTAQITASLDHAPETELVVTLNNGATITFGPTYTPGDLVSSTTFPINNGEDVYVDNSSFVVSVSTATGGNFESLITTDTATVTVTDTTTPVIAELTVDKTAVSEGAADLVYTVTLKDADGNLTPANNAVTVETAYGQIIIAQGASSGTLVKPVQGDDVYVDGETLSNNITSVTEANAGTAGSFEQIDFDSTNVVSTTVSDTTDTTGVSLTASPNLTEAGGDLTYTVTLDSPVRAGDDPVTVTFTDLNGDSQTITISSGSTGTQLVNIPSSLFEDVYKEAPADVAIATGVTVSGGADFESLGTPTVGTITITDTDTDVTLTLNDVSVNEGTGTAQITASLDHAPETELIVYLSNGATITFGPTYTPGDLVSSTPFSINNGEDVYVDESSFVVSVTGTTGGNFENLVITDTATVTVTDTITPVTAELTVDKTAISEGAADLIYTVTLKDAAGNLTPANNAVTVETTYGTIIIAQGASSGTLVKPVQGDDVYVDGETLSNKITSIVEANAGAPGSFEDLGFKPDAIDTVVSDTVDTTSVSLTASPNLTEAGGDLTYTVTLDSPVRVGDDSVTVTFTDLNGDSQTITISSGSTGTQLVTIPSSLFEDVYKEAPADVAIATGVTVSGGANFEGLGTPTVGTVTITDTITPATITLSDVVAQEGESKTITATVDHKVTGSDLIITLGNGTSITIPVGATTGTSNPFLVQTDDVYKDGEDYTVGITGTAGGNYEQLITTATSAVKVSDTVDTTSVSLTASPNLTEAGGDLTYTVTLDSPVRTGDDPVTVTFTDLNGAEQTITISSGKTGAVTVTIPSTKFEDVYKEAPENITIATGVTVSGGDSFEALGTPSVGTVTITDTIDPVYAQISVDQASVLEGGTLTYTVNLVDGKGDPVIVAAGKTVTVELDWSGVAANANDLDGFASLPTSVTIGAGASSAPSFSVTTTVDSVTEYSEPLTVKITGVQDNTGVDQGFENLQISTSKNSVTSNILDAPTITAVDDNGSAINGQITVYEKGLNDSADTSETATGTLRVTAPSGLDSISVAGTNITLAQLQGLADAAQTITIAGHGTLKLTGMTSNTTINGGDGVWDISYEYTLTDAQTHADAGGTNSLLKDIALGVIAKTADGTGVIAQVGGTLGVLVIDDVPQAANDTGTIVEDGANPLTGNVLTNDKLGADTQTNPVVEVGFGATLGTIGTALSGAYGQLTLNADGTYSYKLDNDNAAVNALKTGKSLTEIFNYTIKDADGDSSTATITITINGKTDGAPSIVANDENGAGISGNITVKESGLSNGSDAAANTENASGTITVTALDGLQSITIGGQSFTLVELNALSTTTPSAAITVAGGTLVVTGFSATTSAGGVPTAGTLNYTYTLTGERTHDKATTDEALTLDVPLSITDAGNATTTGNLVVRVEDDTPTAVADTNSVPSGSYAAVTGNVISNDTQGADGAKVSLVQGKNAATTISPTGNTVVEGTYGNLTIHSDGTYSYQRNAGSEGGVDDVFIYTLRDGDGDTVNTTLTISIADHAPILDIPAAGGATTTVYESGLTGGSEQGSNKHTATGTIGFTAKDGLTTVTLGGHTLTGVNQTFTDGLTARYEYNANGEGVIHYSYTLPEAVDSTTTTSESFAITVTDTDGDAAPAGDLVINIINDAPLVVKDDGEVKEGDTLTKAAIEGLLANDTSGADGWVATGGVIGVKFDSGVVQTVTATGTIIEGTYGTLTLKSDGSYSYQAKPNVTTGPAVFDEFTYTVKDADGDTKETTLTIKVTDVSGALKDTQGTVYESGLADGTAPSDITSKIIDQSLNLDSNWTVKELKTVTTAAGTFTVKTDGTYSYVLNSAVTESNVDFKTESFEFDVIDAYGNIAKNTVTIKIMDDAPLAEADIASITEDDALGNTVVGNVFANDKLGADNANSAAPVTDIQFGTATGSVGDPLPSAYGLLVLNADGTYTYTLDNDNAAVNALKTGQSLTEVFTYTITDADGDTATTTLTITINGKTDGDPTIIPDDGNETKPAGVEQEGQATVYEKGLVETDNSQITTGTITLNTPDGLASINVGGTLITLAQLQGLSPTTQIAITTPQGIITVTGFTPGTTVGGVPIAGEVAYTYTLTTVQSTPVKPAPDADLGLNNFDNIALVVTDAGGATHSGSLQVNIIDDTPTANDDSVDVVADGFAANGNVVANDRQGADTAKVTKVTTAGGADVVVPETGTVKVVGVHGTLTIQADGTYTYQRADNVKSGSVDEFTYTLTDADGDTDTAKLTVTVQDGTPTMTIPTVGGAGTTVYESGLSNGTSTDKNLKTTSGTIDFFTNDGVPSITLAGQTLTLTDTAITGANGLTARYEHDPATGLGKIHYTYTLPETVIDTAGDTSKTFAVTVSDGDTAPDSATGNLVIKVVNDKPLVAGDSTIPTIEVDETALATSNTGAFAGAFTVNYGADGQATAGALVYSLEINSAIATGMTDVATGKAIDLFMNGTSVEGRVAGTTDVAFTVSVDTNGQVTLTQDRALRHPNTTNPDDAVSLPNGALSLKATVTDGDGDQASASISLGNKLSFKDDGPTMTVDSTKLGSLMVDESDLADGKVTSTDAAFINGVFDVNYGADGSAGTTYALSVKSAGVSSGLFDTATGTAINLYKVDNDIVGKVGASTGAKAFTISINATTGAVTLTQNRPIKHPDTTNPDDAVSLPADAIRVTATAKDRDGDTVKSADVGIGGRFTFKDDGPSITAATTDTTVDEKGLIGGSDPQAGLLTATGNLNVKFGTDKSGDVVFTDTASGSTTAALTALNLASQGTALQYVVSADGHTLTAYRGASRVEADKIFSVVITNPKGVDGQPGYSFTLQGPLDHAVGADPVDIVLGFTNLVVTDRDGDSVTTSFNVLVKDDVPAAKAITVDEDSTALSTDKGNTFNTNADATQSNTSIDAGAMPAHGTATVNSNGTITYVPKGNYSGADTFTYTTTVNGVSKTFTVNVTVNPISDAPQLEDNKTLVTPEDTSIALGLEIPVVTDKNDQNTTATLGDDPERLGVITLSLTGTAIGTLTNAAGDVTYTNTGGVYKFVITDVANLHLSGLTSGDSTVNYVTQAEYEALMAKPAADRHENFTVKVSVDSYEVDGSGNKLASVPGANSSQTITVDVQAVTDDIGLKVQQGVVQTDVTVVISGTDKIADITFNEDTSFNLTSILNPAVFKDLDGSETRYLGLTGLPEGTIITVDDNTFTVGTSSLGFPQAPTIKIDGVDVVGMSIPGTEVALPNITITPPKDFSGDLTNINVILGALDADADSKNNTDFVAPVWKTDSVTINLHVKPVAGDVVAGNVTTVEDTAVAFLKEVRVTDTGTTNGTEVIDSVAFEIPTGWTVTPPTGGAGWSVSGTGVAGSPYTITFTAGTEAEREAVLKGFMIKPPAHSSKNATIDLTIKTTDTNTTGADTKTVIKPVIVTVTPVAEKVGVDSDGANGTDVTINPNHSYDTQGVEDEFLLLGTEDSFKLSDNWSNEDGKVSSNTGTGFAGGTGSEDTYALLTPYQVIDNNIKLNGTGDPLLNSTFEYTDSNGVVQTVKFTGTPVKIPVQNLDSVKFKGPENYKGVLKIKVEAGTVDYDEDTGVATGMTTSGESWLTSIVIQPQADQVTLKVEGRITMLEDTAKALDIKPVSSDKSEKFNISIAGIPTGASITYKGIVYTENSSAAADGNGVSVVKTADGFKLDIKTFDTGSQPILTPPKDSNLPIKLNIEAVSVDSLTYVDAAGVTQIVTSTATGALIQKLPINVTVTGDPDDPVVELVQNKVFVEDGGDQTTGQLSVNLNELITDFKSGETGITGTGPDGSETVTLRISDLPAGFTLTDAGPSLGGSGTTRVWVITKAQLADVKIVVPKHYSGEVKFTVQPVVTESDNPSEVFLSKENIKFTVTPVPEASLSISSSLTEDTLGQLNLAPVGADEDEYISAVRIAVGDVPAGVVLYDAAGVALTASGGFYTVNNTATTGAPVVQVKGPDNFSGSKVIKIEYQVTDPTQVGTGAAVVSDWKTAIEHTLNFGAVTDKIDLTLGAITGGSTDAAITTTTGTGTVTVGLNITQKDDNNAGNTPDVDGSEKFIHVVISGVPEGVSVKGAIETSKGEWLLTVGDVPFDTATLTQNIEFVVSGMAGTFTAPITITTYTKDTNAPSFEADSVEWTLVHTTEKSEESDLPTVSLDSVGFVPTEDTKFSLGQTVTGTLDPAATTAGEFQVTVTVRTTPEDTTVYEGMTRTVVNEKVDGVDVPVVLWTATVSEATKDTGQAKLDALLNSIKVVTPPDSNKNNIDGGKFVIDVNVSVHADGVSLDAQAKPELVITPDTDTLTVSVSNQVVNEGQDIALSIGLSSTGGADGNINGTGAGWTVVGDKVFIHIADTTLDGKLLVNGVEKSGSTTAPDGSPSGLTGGTYYEVAVSDLGQLVFKPNVATEPFQTGNLDVTAWVEHQENNSPDGNTVVSSGTGSLTIQQSNSGYKANITATGDEAQDSANKEAAIKLDFGADSGLIDSAETVNSAFITGLPTGFTVYIGADAASSVLANNAGNQTWAIPVTGGALPAHIAILPPVNWSGSLADLKLTVLSGHAGAEPTPTEFNVGFTITPKADGIELNPTLSFGDAGEKISLNLNASMKDSAASDIAGDVHTERTELTLTGFPGGDRVQFFVNGITDDGLLGGRVTNNGSGSYTIKGLTQAELDSLQFIHDGTGQATIGVKAHTYEVNGAGVQVGANSASVAGTIEINVSPTLATAGSDTFLWSGQAIDGLVGEDTVQLRFGDDLGSTDFAKLSNIEVIDMQGANSGSNSITGLTTSDVLNMTDGDNLLKILGDGNDSFTLNSAEWTQDATNTNQYKGLAGVGGTEVTLELSGMTIIID
jgi:T1SS-143 domain-containing protein